MRTDLLAALAAALVLAGCADDGDGSADRQDDVAERGAQVMPFDLDVTTHRFEPTDNGLIETVVADRPDDAEQVALVQQHLTEEAGRFRNGDYGDPAAIHVDDMPGPGGPRGPGGIDRHRPHPPRRWRPPHLHRRRPRPRRCPPPVGQNPNRRPRPTRRVAMCRARNRTAVRQRPHAVLTDLFHDGHDPQVERFAIRDVDDVGRVLEARDVG
jgi:hypothetical protein